MRRPKRLLPHEWAARNREYPETSGKPGPRDPFLTPYMVPLSTAVVSGLYNRAVAVTSAQSAKTETALDLIGHRLDQRPAPILFVGPSQDFMRDQFEPRLTQMIDECPSFAAKKRKGKQEKKTLKIIAGARVRLASGASSSALKSDPAALAFVDEYDEMSATIKGQGDPLGLVEARGESYPDFVTAIMSTPSKGVVETEVDEVNGLTFWKEADPKEVESPIWGLFQSGTRHHWAWPCPHCGEYFVPMRKHLEWDGDTDPALAHRTAHLVCPSNGCTIDEGEDGEAKAEMNRQGIMIAPGQSIEEAKEGSNAPDNPTYSQWTSGLCSPFVSWGLRAERMVKAMNSGDEHKVQTAVNAGFGEVYMPGLTGEMPDWQELLGHKSGLGRNEIHAGMMRFVLACDVQGSGIYFVLRAFGPRGTSWLLDHGFLMGRTVEDQVWDDLQMIIDSPIGDSAYHIDQVLIDSGFRPDKPNRGSEHRVYQFCRINSRIVQPVKGRSTNGSKPISVSNIEVETDGGKSKYSLKLLMSDTDFFKSMVHSRIKTPLGKAGAFYLHDEAGEEYARQVLSEVRLVKPGAAKPVWKQIKRDNHYFDCEAMAALGGYMLNVHRIPERTQAEHEPRPTEGASDTEAGEKKAPEDDEPALSSRPPRSRDRSARLRNLGQRSKR